jgi:para-aminobenzoate synthetase / 4-amino-4-deoxychorismate lyase
LVAAPAQPRPDREEGILETLLVIAGIPVELDAHLARLEASLAVLFPDRSPPDLEGAIRARAQGIERGSLRVRVAPAGRAGIEATVRAAEIAPELIFPPAPSSVAVHSLVLAGGLGGHKWADRALVDRAQAKLASGAVPLIVEWDGSVLEASRGNAFAVTGGVLTTPPADGRILPGIARARTIEIAAEAGLEVREAALTRDDLLQADEVFLTSSVRGLERVRSLDGTELRASGKVALRIAAELRRSWVDQGAVG